MAMTTRCPHCGTAFKVVADQLRVRNGLVRCGVCSRVFDGHACVVDGPAGKPAAPPPAARPDTFADLPPDDASPVLSVKAPTAPGPAAHPYAPPRPYVPPRHQPTQSYGPPEHPTPSYGPPPAAPQALPEPAVLRGRDAGRRLASDPREPVLSPRTPAPHHDAGEDEDHYGYREPYAPHDQDETDDAQPQADDMALPQDDRFRIYAHRDAAEDDEPAFVPVPGEVRTRYDDLTDAGMAPPIFMDEDVQRRRTLLARLWAAGCLLGVIVLGLQCIYIYRTAIATAVPALRPALAAACAPLGCQVGYARRLERISITASSLQPQSGVASDDGVMRLTLRVTLRNRYDKPQPWPALVLQLTDLSDTVVVRKVLLPENYLPPGTQGPFPAGGEQSLAVPLQVDGLHVNGYQLDKFFP